MKEFYTVGETAALLGVSADTLRYYDRIGLLKPAKTDAGNRYRYYSYAQFHMIDRIKYLQRFGMPLEEIRQVMSTGRVDELLVRLKAEREHIREELTQIQHRMEDVDWYINYFTYMDRNVNEEPIYQIHLPERYIVKCPCLYQEPLAAMEVRLAGVKATPPYLSQEYKRQYGYILNVDSLFQREFYPEYYFIFFSHKPDLPPETYDILPEGDYQCFRTQVLKEHWDPELLKTYFGKGDRPQLVLALEFEDNLREYQDAWYEVQMLAGPCQSLAPKKTD